MASLPSVCAPVNSRHAAHTLRSMIRELLELSSQHVRWNGVVEHRFAGVVTLAMHAAIWNAFRSGQLLSHSGSLYASRGGCHVAFTFGHGASTSTFVWFSFVDERQAAA